MALPRPCQRFNGLRMVYLVGGVALKGYTFTNSTRHASRKLSAPGRVILRVRA